LGHPVVRYLTKFKSVIFASLMNSEFFALSASLLVGS